MTDTLISLISLFIGIFAGNLCGWVFKKYSFGSVGNSIAGVFGSAFLIKSFGRLGFGPVAILASGTINYTLLSINLLVSFIGGALAIIILKKLKNKMEK